MGKPQKGEGKKCGKRHGPILNLKLHQCFMLTMRNQGRAAFPRILNVGRGQEKPSQMTLLPMNHEHQGMKQWWKRKLKQNEILGDKRLVDCAWLFIDTKFQGCTFTARNTEGYDGHVVF